MFESLTLFVAGPELIILVIIIGVLIFGAAKIPKLAKTFGKAKAEYKKGEIEGCLLYTSPSPRDGLLSRMPSSA